jgi:hypothetical protein
LVVGRTVPKGKSGARWTAKFSGWPKLLFASRHCRDLLRGTKGVGPVSVPSLKTDTGCKRPETGHELRYLMSYNAALGRDHTRQIRLG